MESNDHEIGSASVQSAGSGRREMITFLAATFFVIPGLAVAFVGSYGFLIWAFQMIFGPPGPPG